MDKSEVIELVGTPQFSNRWKGLDRWKYVFYENNNKVEKEIQFDNGNVVYVGEILQPAISAEEQDEIFQKQNMQLKKVPKK